MDIMRGLGIAVYFLLADAVWITQFATKQYRDALGEFLVMPTGMPLAVGLCLVYGLLLLGLFYFVLVEGSGLMSAIIFGFVVYGVYGLTNWLILDRWTASLVLLDFLWGGFLYGSSWYLASVINYLK
ncbi:DUF2177 family protein [Candidatus Synchoanobacter obligatus]|uniref:DUF2177 family protein n=1 Tax=Candidatus Synchoanobacter obligatus TaxID=2919597 RepID=A0ABT1L6F2_9GAMM|nr:DUF2177 family protein [Candidatus Synchoanobacter obligatus]MCP8352463.1 DUF2177 family protein [Candidatus Synchoanobacter obligatus]